MRHTVSLRSQLFTIQTALFSALWWRILQLIQEGSNSISLFSLRSESPIKDLWILQIIGKTRIQNEPVTVNRSAVKEPYEFFFFFDISWEKLVAPLFDRSKCLLWHKSFGVGSLTEWCGPCPAFSLWFSPLMNNAWDGFPRCTLAGPFCAF